ncbi:MAG: hypothetical protein ABWU84_04185 [Pyrobaculum sp.]|uniref:hypothetical protein n=1 Tax=Pyrobaculum sp. TaxID=2004705 RepID=UPI003EEF1EC8
MDILEILKTRDEARIKEALAEVHKQKAFSLADSEFVKEEWENAARLHAHHIALISYILPPNVEADPESITGKDYRLAVAFQVALKTCSEIPPPPGDEFYKLVVEELNRLARSLCSSE